MMQVTIKFSTKARTVPEMLKHDGKHTIFVKSKDSKNILWVYDTQRIKCINNINTKDGREEMKFTLIRLVHST